MNPSFTYAEYAIKKAREGKDGWVTHVNIGFKKQLGGYVSVYKFLIIGKHLTIVTPKDYLHTFRMSEAADARYQYELFFLKGMWAL